MDLLVTLNGGRSGRDKVFRISQYGLKMLWGLKITGEELRKVEKNVASFRRLLRFGTFLDTLHGIKRTWRYGDQNLRVITTLIRLALAGYLVNDHLVWLKEAGIIDINDRFTQRRSDQWWLISILFSLARDAYDLAVAVSERKRRMADNSSRGDGNSNGNQEKNGASSSSSSGAVVSTTLAAADSWPAFARRNKALLLDALTNSLDLWLPLSYLSYVPLPDWAVGAAGVISSVTAAIPHLDASFKMHPSN